MTATPQPGPPRLTSLTVTLAVAVALAGCGTTPDVGVAPGSSVPAESAAPAPTPTPEAVKIEIMIDAKTVSPYRKAVEVDRGQPVVLVTRSDHDTSLEVTGPGIDRTDFIGRLTTISTTFVADVPGTILVKSTDPAATIARLTVS